MEAPRSPTREGADGSGIWDVVFPSSVGCSLGGGCAPLQKIFLFSPKKWCILMHSGAHFTQTVVVTMIMTSTVTFLSCTCSTVQQKGRPRNFCTDFRNSPLNKGLFATCNLMCIMLSCV